MCHSRPVRRRACMNHRPSAAIVSRCPPPDRIHLDGQRPTRRPPGVLLLLLASAAESADVCGSHLNPASQPVGLIPRVPCCRLPQHARARCAWNVPGYISALNPALQEGDALPADGAREPVLPPPRSVAISSTHPSCSWSSRMMSRIRLVTRRHWHDTALPVPMGLRSAVDKTASLSMKYLAIEHIRSHLEAVTLHPLHTAYDQSK